MNEYFRGLLTKEKEKSKVILTGIPFDYNASIGKGAAQAPSHMRELSMHIPPVNQEGKDISNCKIFDAGDISYNDEKCEEYFRRVEATIEKNLNLDKLNLFIGGDHSVAIPIQRAFLKEAKRQNKRACIIHIDAHPDICDEYEGSIYSHACPIKRAIDYGYKKEDILLVGIRGFELQEIEYFEKNPQIERFTSSMIQKNGIQEVIKRIQAKFKKEDWIYISYDIDANDPSYAPGTGTPEAFGLKSQDVLDILLFIFKEYQVKVMDMVEIAPPLDSNDMTSWLALKTLYEIFNIINQRSEK